MSCILNINKDETSIRYAKENDRGKTERRRERERKVDGEIIEREGEIREK